MIRLKSSRPALAALAAATVMLLAGGMAVASNMGFKINKLLVGNRRNWVSIPYNNPYTTNCVATAPNCVGALCQALGLPSGIAGTTVTTLDEVTGTFTNTPCPTATATTGGSFGVALRPGKGAQIRPPSTWPVGGSVIIVGSHNPTLSITVPDAGAVGQVGRYWFAVPYHTTAVTTRDLCVASGLGLTLPAATITLSVPGTNSFNNAACSANPGLTLVLGDHVQITEPNGPKTFIPAHF